MLGDENLLEAFQTIFGITLNTNGNIDNNASIVSRLMPMSDLTNSKKLDQLVERFVAVGGIQQRHDGDIILPRRRDLDHEQHRQRQ